jgi:hypothetical protein
MAGGVHGTYFPVRNIGQLSVGQRPVGQFDGGEFLPLLGGADRGRGLFLGRAETAHEVRLTRDGQFSGAVVRAGEDRVVGRMESDPGAGGPAQPASQPDVIEVHVRDQDAADVRGPGADGLQPG